MTGGDNEGWLDGRGATVRSSVPVQVSGSATFSQMAVGPHFACGIAGGSGGAPGFVLCWGANESGQLGNGTTTNSSVPAQVSGSATFSPKGTRPHFTPTFISGGGFSLGNNFWWGGPTRRADWPRP